MSVHFSIALNHKCKQPADYSREGIFLEGNNGACILLMHGLTGTPNEMRYLAIALNKAGYTVSLPRLAIHGEPMEIFKHAKWQDFYQTACQAVTDLENKGYGGSIYSSGLCMGAMLMLIFASEFPARIAGLSCLSPTFDYDGWAIPWTRIFLPLIYMTPLKHYLYFKEDPPYGVKNEIVRKRIHDYYGQADLNNLQNVADHGYPYFPMSLLHEHYKLAKAVLRKLGNVHVPVQIMQASNDDMSSAKNSWLLYNKIGSAVKEIELLQNSYHLITMDHERDTVVLKVKEFFDRLRTQPTDLSQDGFQKIQNAG